MIYLYRQFQFLILVHCPKHSELPPFPEPAVPSAFIIFLPVFESLGLQKHSLSMDLTLYRLLLLLLSRFSRVRLCATPIDGSPPGSPILGILQARTLEWVGISFSNTWKWKVKVKSLSRFWLLATPWTAAYQAPPSMGFSRQEYWSGVPLPSLDYYPGI